MPSPGNVRCLRSCLLLYFLTIFITLGVLTPDEMAATLTPLSSAAAVFLGRPGFVILALAAMLAFVTTANAGLMAASRSPMAMSRDGLLPAFIGRVSHKHQTPVTSILLTSAFMISCIVFLEIEDLIKVASTMKLLMFLFGNISVILMRQSKLVAYRPSFKTPLYPRPACSGHRHLHRSDPADGAASSYPDRSLLCSDPALVPLLEPGERIAQVPPSSIWWKI